MTDSWDDLADWWALEVQNDRSYAADVYPILTELMPEAPGATMDLGCGEGQGMRWCGRDAFGCDLSQNLLVRSAIHGGVVRAHLPDMRWLRAGSLQTAFSVYVLDLIEDHERFFAEAARAVRVGGSLVVVINHPAYTAPGSAPLVDPDGEILWRWGSYFQRGSSSEPAGDSEIQFHHRSMADLLSAAGRTGWKMEVMIERGLSAETIAQIPGYGGQEGIPRLLGVHWTLT